MPIVCVLYERRLFIATKILRIRKLSSAREIMHKLPLIKVSYFVDMGYHKRRSGMFSSIKSTAQIRRTFQRVSGYWKKDRQLRNRKRKCFCNFIREPLTWSTVVSDKNHIKFTLLFCLWGMTFISGPTQTHIKCQY